MLYLYALAAELGEVADMRGAQGEPLVLLPFRQAVVVAGNVAAKPPIDADSLTAQDALVRQLHERAAALLPMRFGMTIADATMLDQSLNARLIDRLQMVRRCEQMVVRVFGATANPDAPARAGGFAADLSGRSYLEQRVRAHKGSAELGAIAAAAAPLQREVRIEPATQPGVHGSVYHLIERGKSDEYRTVIERAVATLPDVRVMISGPSPAYAFA
jgi:hypothetical protein